MNARYLNAKTWPTMVWLLKSGFIRGHGIARKNPVLYRLLNILRDKGLVKRNGYKYYPTKDGWRAYFRTRDIPTLDQFIETEKKVEWKEIFNC